MPVRSGFDAGAVAAAAQALCAGELVAFPTETVYGLGARADDDAAVARIFAAKGRPSDHPLIVHVADRESAQRFADGFSPPAKRLADAFWPGPLTLIVARAAGMAQAAAGGQASLGLRCPAHPVAQALLRQCAALGVQGIAAPSANRFGRISPTSAVHVVSEFGAELRVLDGGPCGVGIESAIVDCSRGRPVLLRPGVLTRTRLEQALGQALAEPDANSPRAPGTLQSHYAPRAALRLVDAMTLQSLGVTGSALAALTAPTAPIATAGPAGPAEPVIALALPASGLAVYSRFRPALPAGALWSAMPSDPTVAARELFAALRELDRPEIAQIWVEQPPDTQQWEGVRDRLRRAAASAGVPANEMDSR